MNDNYIISMLWFQVVPSLLKAWIHGRGVNAQGRLHGERGNGADVHTKYLA